MLLSGSTESVMPIKLPSRTELLATAKSNPRFGVQVLKREQLDDDFLEAWENLAEESLDPNLFLTPAFVLPALQYLTPEVDPLFMAIGDSDSLDGLAILTRMRASRHMPLGYYAAYRCPHTYMTGVLLNKDNAHAACEQFFRFVRSGLRDCHAIEFRQLDADSESAKLMYEVARKQHAEWCEFDRYERAILVPSEVHPETYLNDVLSYKRRGAVRRARRRLEELGSLRFAVHSGQQVNDQVIDTFLALENDGWKGKQGTSLAAKPNHAEFFRDFTQRASANGKALFTELQLDGEPIASTANFFSGDTAFAFKFGWAERFEKYSLGIVQAIAYARSAPDVFGHVRYIDSCTECDSFVEKLWPERKTIASGMFVTSSLGRICISALNGLRALRQRLKG